MMQGRGEFSWYKGDFYEGGYRANKKHGHGRYVDTDGKEYVGNWSHGMRHG